MQRGLPDPMSEVTNALSRKRCFGHVLDLLEGHVRLQPLETPHLLEAGVPDVLVCLCITHQQPLC